MADPDVEVNYLQCPFTEKVTVTWSGMCHNRVCSSTQKVVGRSELVDVCATDARFQTNPDRIVCPHIIDLVKLIH